MLLTLLLGACGKPPPEVHRLADLYRPILVLNTGGTPETVQVFLHPELAGICHPIEPLTGSIGGRPLTRLHGMAKSGDLQYDRDCAVFEFSADPPASAPLVELVVTDGGSTARMEVADLFAPRVVTGPATAKPGEEVALSWSPATDVFAPKGEIGVELRSGEERVVIPRKDLRIEGNVIRFTMPELAGAVTASVLGTSHIQPKVTLCEFAHRCEVSRLYTVEGAAIEVR